jgi:hypothetical protein
MKLILLMSALLFVAAPSFALTLAKDGAPVAKIYVSPLPKPDPKARKPAPESGLATAVRELNYHLQKMSGATLQVVGTDDVRQIKAPAIVLGDLAVKLGAVPQKKSESKEGFRLLTKNGLLLIGGESDDGVLFGADAVLEKLGCDWVMPGEIGEIIPQRKTVEIGDLDESQAPAFAMRRLWYRGGSKLNTPEDFARFETWSRRLKAGSYRPPAAETAGHYWDQFIKKHKAEFEKDPTMYALRRAPDGTLQRMGPQIESTHPRVIELMVQDIKDAFEKNQWPHDKAVGFPIGPADGLGFSESIESQLAGSGRKDAMIGVPDQTDLLVLLANKIFEKLGPEYPNVYLGNYSYAVYEDYPMRYKPNPHYVQIFAPINFSRMHSLLDPHSKSQAYYKSVVEQWGKLAKEQGNPLIYRGYNWNLAENMMPYSKLQIWGEELPFYHEMGVLGLNVEATKAWSVNGPSDWLFMKLAWNSDQDWKALLHEYCAKAFGAGAAPMERYFLRLTATQSNAGQEAGSYWSFPLIYDDRFIQEARRDFEEAIQLAQSPQEKTRIGFFADNVTALELYLKYFRATENFQFAEAKADYDAMLAHWQKQYDANSDLVAKEVPQYLNRFVAQFVDQSVQYSSGDYKLVSPLPDELPTLFDPNGTGEQMRFQGTAISDAGLLKTKTFSSTWDAQGLAALRSSAVWYRHHFTLPADLKGKPVGLFIGGVDDEARVWINGRFIGSSGRGFSKPFAFDLTDGIRYDGDNVLAIEVVRNSAANELGTGGLLRPSFLFTGPRLEAKAPKPLELRRVLPGGELGAVKQ